MEMKQALSFLSAFQTGNTRSVAAARRELQELSPEGWSGLLSELKLLEMAPLFYRYLAEYSLAGAVPPEVCRGLQREYYLHGARNAVILHDLGALVSALKTRGIEGVLLKGACLVELVYDDIAVRPMQDIDILVRYADLAEVERLLVALGYGPAERPPVEVQCRAHHHLIPFTCSGRPAIEVHWSLTPAGSRHPLTLEGLRERVVEVQAGEQTFLMPGPGDLLLHLCLHLSATHHFSILELKNLCDIAQVLKRCGDRIDWKALGETTRSLAVGKYVYSTLLVAGKLFGAVLPPEGLAELDHDDNDSRIAEVVAEYLLNYTVTPLPQVFEELEGQRGLRRRFGVISRRLFPPYSYLVRKYALPGSVSRSGGILYLRHWVGALARGLRLLAHMSLRSRRGKATVVRRKQEILIHDWLKAGINPET